MSDSEIPRPNDEPEGASGVPLPPPLADAPAQEGFQQAFASTGPPPRRRRERRAGASGRGWLVLSLLILLGGCAAAYLGAGSVQRSDQAKAQSRFRSSAATLASSVAVALQHEEDLGIAGSTYFAGDPTATAAQFESWLNWTETLRRYPELASMGLISIVKAAQLSEFRALGPAALSKPAPATTAPPSGGPSYYCLTSAELVRSAAYLPRAGTDYCAGSERLLASRDLGVASYTHIRAGHAKALEVDIPVYLPGTQPTTPAARMAVFVGWLREVLLPGTVLSQVLHGQDAAAVRIRYLSPATHVVFTAGRPRPGEQERRIAIQAGWTVESFGTPPAPGGLMSDSSSELYLIAGVVLSALVALLVLMIGAGERAGAPARARDAEEELYDPLTGLPNRVLMLDRAAGALARAGRESGMLAGALFVEIDAYRDVRERLGEEAAGQLRKVVAERLAAVIRGQDTVGRIGGDEFLILVEAAARGVRLDSLARRIIESLRRPVELEGFGPSFVVTASVGIAFGRYSSVDELLRDARAAMDASRSAGRDRYTLFNANMRSVQRGGGVLEVDLSNAVREGQFFLVYQPIVELASRTVVGLEAQVRWQHPTQGILAAENFMSLAEETGLIVPIGRWMLEEACERAAALEVSGNGVGVCVPVSPAQLAREGFETDVLRALQRSGLEPAKLTLQLLEGSLMRDVSAAASRLAEVKGLGVKVAIADFGGGYAYHSDLRQLPIDYLCVDRSELAASDDEDYRSWLFEAILILGRELSMTVIATAVNSQEQMSALRETDCGLAKGSFVCPPIPAASLQSLFPPEPDESQADDGDAAEAAPSGEQSPASTA